MCTKHQSSHSQAPADTLRAEVETEMKPEVNIAVTLVDRNQADLVLPTETEAGHNYLFCCSRGQQTDPKLDQIFVGSLVVVKVQALYSKRLKKLFRGIVLVNLLSSHKAKKSLWSINAIAIVCSKPHEFPANVDSQEELKRQPVYLWYFLRESMKVKGSRIWHMPKIAKYATLA